MPTEPRGPEPVLETLLERLLALCDPSDADRLAELADRLQTGSLRVLLAGEAKRGKSTLANALLGRDLLPSGVTPVTSLATEVRQGDPERIEMTFEDDHTMTGPVDDLHLYVSEKDNPQNAKHVARVSVFLSEGLPHPRMVLVDTPGAGSVLTHNTDAAAAAYESMDAAVFVLTADAPLSASELELFAEVSALSVRRFVVLNKADLIEDSEIPEVRAFIEDSVESATGERPQLILCSARRALSAQLGRDRNVWRSSGVSALLDALTGELVEHGEDVVRRSVAEAARRVAVRAVDEAAATQATVRAVSEHRNQQMDEFAARIDETAQRSGEAVSLVTAQADADLRVLNDEAQNCVRTLATESLAALERVFAASSDLPASELDSVGRQALADLVRDGVEAWRSERHQRLAETLEAQAERQQNLLRRDARELADATKEVLGVELLSPAVTLPVTSLSKLPLDLSRQASWNSSVTDALRMGGRAGAARQRVADHLRQECYWLVDKGIGRARADLQTQMTETTRELATRVAHAFAEQAAGLKRAHAAARELASRPSAERAERSHALTARLADLREIVHRLDDFVAGPTHDAVTDGAR